jgi:hypothetical protein
MKNTFKLKAIQRIAGIIALLAVIGLSMAACGGDDPGLVGTKWERTGSIMFQGETTFQQATFTLSFLDGTRFLDEFVRVDGRTGESIGTYTFNGSKGTLIYSSEYSNTFEIAGSKLIVSGDGWSDVYTKK